MINILIIEDLQSRNKIKDILKSENYNLSICNNTKDGLGVLFNSSIDIILLGAEIGKEFLKYDVVEILEMPIILTIEENQIDIVDNYLKAGVKDILRSPFIIDEIRNKISFWIGYSKKDKEIKNATRLLEEYKNIVDRSSIVSKTDSQGVITFVNDKFCELSGYSREELLGKNHSFVRHPDMKSSTFEELWHTIRDLKKPWIGEVKNKKKDGGYYIVKAIINPILDQYGNILEYIAMRIDITDMYEANSQIKSQTKLLNEYKDVVDKSSIVSKTDPNGSIIFVNDRFCELSGYSREELLGKNHSFVRHPDMPASAFKSLWYTIKELKQTWRGEVKNLKKNGDYYIVDATISPVLDVNGNTTEYIAMRTDITESYNREKEIALIHKNTKDSIEYASLIQGSLLPQKGSLSKYFKDSFVHWEPKDTVGGDIWLFDDLRHDDECILFFIDCTGHGVPGAFVTMIVKAVEREILTKINEDLDMDVSPAWIMSYFNKTMKSLLKQDLVNSKSNAGWDGGIIYYNKKDKIIKFAGAETPLFYIDNRGILHNIKGNRYSVGYKKCDIDYHYNETIIEVEEGMKFYCTTDGYLDQNGGEKDFPFGKKRFSNLIKEIQSKPMSEQKDILIKKIEEYESMVIDNDRNDDITVIGFEI